MRDHYNILSDVVNRPAAQVEQGLRQYFWKQAQLRSCSGNQCACKCPPRCACRCSHFCRCT